MKFVVLFLLGLSLSSFSAESGEGGKAHTDWNKVSPQPVADTSKSVLPESTKLLTPQFLEKVKTTEVLLKWEEVAGVEYYLQVATDPVFKWMIVNTPNMKTTEFNLKNLEAGKQYFWRVYTQKPNNWAGYTKGVVAKSAFEVVK